MQGVQEKCKLETHASRSGMQKEWHAQFLRAEPRIVCAATLKRSAKE
jgi:hypothetical protein